MTQTACQGGAGGLPAIDQLAALLAWRGPGTHAAALSVLAGVHAFASDVQSAYHRASSKQLEAMLRTNDCVSELAAQLAASRDPERALALQVDIALSLAKSGIAATAAWAELAQELTEAASAIAGQASAAIIDGVRTPPKA